MTEQAAHPNAVDLGWGRDPIPKQLAGSRLSVEAMEHADKDADAVLRLHIRGLITTSMRDHAMRKIIKEMEASIKKEPRL